MALDVGVSERALREVYLRPFQIAVRDGKPGVVMSSYNKVNGVHVSESRLVLDLILGREWGFEGLVMSDWYGTYSCAESLNAGLDMEMPGPARYRNTQAILAAVSSGKVGVHTIDERARKVLGFVKAASRARVADQETTRDSPEDRKLNRELATESVVLLKNSAGALLVDAAACADVAAIGPNAGLAAACGGGGLALDLDEGIRRAAHLARRCGHAFVVAGLNADLEKEGMDRASMRAARSPCLGAPAIVHSWYGGCEAGNTAADVLFGAANPSGRLPVTFPDRLEDGPAFLSFGSDNGSVMYAEDVFVDYRWFEARRIEPAFPFGHRLSYTTFRALDLRVSDAEVALQVENTGSRSGAELVRLYVSFVTARPPGKLCFLRPLRTLAGFEKVFLAAGECKLATLPIRKDGISVWDERRQSWCCEAGEYSVSAVTSADSLEGTFTIVKDIYWTGLECK
ncbi:hypothetical protein RB594_004242 [Gaeumannomyces avenae]